MIQPSVKSQPLLFLLATALLFSLGLSLVFPVLPFIVMRYVPDVHQQPAAIGWLAASYALLSFFSAPVMGALSDAYGRRPVILLSLLGSAVGYLVFGIGGSLAMLFLGRSIDGLTSGGLSALFGYVADTTPEDQRGKVFGQIGAVVGAGFIVGPAIGGALSHISVSAPVYAAAGVSMLNLLWGFFVLPESLKPSQRTKHFTAAHLNPLTQLRGVLAYAQVRRLVTVSVLFTLPFSLMQLALSLLARDTLGWGPAQVSTAFMVVGVCDVVGQGVLLPHFIKALGEKGVAQLGLGMGVVGMICLALLPHFAFASLLYFSVVLFALGEGIFNATLSALISVATPPEAQGQVQGGSQAFASLAQVVGPLGGGVGYSRFGPGATFGVAAGLVMLAFGLLSRPTPQAAREEALSQ